MHYPAKATSSAVCGDPLKAAIILVNCEIVKVCRWRQIRKQSQRHAKPSRCRPLGPLSRVIEDAKTINANPADSPMAEVIENFERALREGRAIEGQH
jgi:hypothetical protein